MHATQRSNWWAWSAGLVLLGSVGLCVCIVALVVGPFTPAFANYIPHVVGKAELLAPAQWESAGGTLSPDGRFMLVGWQRDGEPQTIIWNLVTNATIVKRTPGSASVWLMNDTLVTYNPSPWQYTLVNAHTGAAIPATIVGGAAWRRPSLEEQAAIQARWRQASHLFLIDGLGGYSAVTVVSVEQGQPFVYLLHTPPGTPSVQQLAAGIPHQYFPREDWTRAPQGKPFAARASGLQAQAGTDATGDYLRILSPEGTVMAEVSKPGWFPDPLGWAHDDSGVYFRLIGNGQGGGMLVRRQAIFKLRPLTAAEAQQQVWWQLARWLSVLCVLGAVCWWGWRRWRRRAAAARHQP